MHTDVHTDSLWYKMGSDSFIDMCDMADFGRAASGGALAPKPPRATRVTFAFERYSVSNLCFLLFCSVLFFGGES